MSSFAKFVMPLVVVAALMMGGSLPELAAQGKSGSIFKGVPRDIDFIKNMGGSQVIMTSLDRKEDLIAKTKNDRIQSILLVALSLRSVSIVEYVEQKSNEKWLTSVNLSLQAKKEQGHILSLSSNDKDNRYQATICDQGTTADVWTTSAQMQSILETAALYSIPVQEFSFDPTAKEITRGKVNVELRKR